MSQLAGRFQVLEGDYLAFQRQYFRRNFPRFLLFVAVVVALVAVLAAMGAMSSDAILGGIAGALAMSAAVFALAWFWTVPRNVRRLYRESVSLREPTEVTLNEEGLRFVQPSGDWRLRWADLTRWDETEQFLAVFPNRAMAHILPKRDLPSELIDFARASLLASGLQKPWRLRK